MKSLLSLLFLAAATLSAADARAKNVILFLGDAGGVATLNAASIHAHGAPKKLYIHSMPNIALSETSAAAQWVTDSAAGMTAIVTGHKTHNGVIAQSATAVRGKQDGEPLKTILEHAEERGLSTGVITNSAVLSATPAALYAHANDRRDETRIFQHLLKPRFGDGVDVVIGAGRGDVIKAAQEPGTDLSSALKKAGLPLYESIEAIPGNARRAVVLFDGDFDLDAATQRAIDILSRNPKGFFLMVESDLHTSQVLVGLNHAVALDRAIRNAASRLKDTLLLFTADHSYDFRVFSGRRGEPMVAPGTAPDFGRGEKQIRTNVLRRDDNHTGEEVIVAAQGPGAERVRGFLANTDIFHIMMAAYGWK